MAWNQSDKLIARISKSIIEGSVSHAYIIEGDTTTDKMGFAMDFLKAIVCKEKPGIGCDECISCRKLNHGNYEDLYIVESEFNTTKTAKSVRDESIDKLQENLSMKPFNERNLSIICDADSMTVRAQNRLLKTLEEPPFGTIIILLSENKENLLETVRSRCISYRLNGMTSTIPESAERAVDIILSNEGFSEIKELISEYAKDKIKALEMLDGMEIIFRNIMVLKDDRYRRIKSERVFRAIELIEEARRDIRYNVNYAYALKNMLLKIKEKY